MLWFRQWFMIQQYKSDTKIASKQDFPGPNNCKGKIPIFFAELRISKVPQIKVAYLTYPHLWSWNLNHDRTRSQIQAAKMSFLCRVAGLSLIDRLRTSVILRVRPLLHHIKRSLLRWLWLFFQMPPGHLPWEMFQACPTGRMPRGQPDLVEVLCLRLVYERLRLPPAEMEELSVVQ